ncbi:hypothetical protein ACPEEZ_01020 [Frigoribacterium sp. 2-23]|uniref:hypothetical protein n=1 Tax=Frigoribacterium sp. 2-23 TaxID=3415006 RepID=UPI003C6F85EC
MTITSHDLAGLSHDRLLSTITRTLGVSGGFERAEIDSYYTRASNVRPVHIDTYPKRRRSSRLSAAATTAASIAAAVSTGVAGSSAAADAGPSYADFFAQPHAMTA